MNLFTVSAEVQLDTKSFNAQADEAVQKGKQMSEELGQQGEGIKGMLKNAFSFATGKLLADAGQKVAQFALDFAKESISIASNIQEVQNVVDVTFGDAASRIETWADSARTQFGLTELQAKQYASTIGAMFKSMGIAEDQVYDMSTAMAGLASDMASFYNLDFDTAFQKIRSGISGETEPLKQLGINMSVANLEAYALSQGITKSVEKMSQAEQATLRYNYLLSVTADAQGDFARTSDSYANSLRKLETSVDTLKSHLGEMLLPVVNDVVNTVNSLFDDHRTLTDKIADTDAALEQTSASIAASDVRAQSYINTLESLSGKTDMTTEETAQWNAAVSSLIAIYPQLSGMIGTNTGELNASIAAIRDETAALKQNALEKAKAAAMQDKIDAWASVAVKAGETKTELDAEWAAWQDTATEMNSILNQIAEKTHQTIEEVGNPDIWEPTQIERAYGEEVRILAERYQELVPLYDEQNDKVNELTKTYNEYDQQMTEAQADIDKARESLEAMGSTTEETASQTEDATKSLSEMQSKLKEQEKALHDAHKASEDYAKGIKEKVLSALDSVYDGYSKVSRIRPASAKSQNQNAQAQMKQLQDYMDGLEKLREMGVDENLIAELSDGSQASMGRVAGLAKSKQSDIDTYVATLKELQEMKESVSEVTADNVLKIDPAYQTLLYTEKQALQDLYDAAFSLQDFEGGPTITVDDQASSVLEGIQSRMNAMTGGTITIKVTPISDTTIPDGKYRNISSRAVGIDSVPYDGFLASLHEGEAILTKAENRQRRSGTVTTGQPISVTVNVSGNASSPYQIGREVRTALENMRWLG
ncbi:MAG: hypothetical protein MR762_05225 [Clostridiales bacterium]|nr:hypothetical protein [Clostridiales bacterium]